MINKIYDWANIGNRIYSERKKMKLSQEELAYRVGIVRQTISKLERGDAANIGVDTLLKLCDTFDCELGYLLCEYDCKTRAATDIQDAIGLDESTIDILTALHDTTKRSPTQPKHPALMVIDRLVNEYDQKETPEGENRSALSSIIDLFQIPDPTQLQLGEILTYYEIGGKIKRRESTAISYFESAYLHDITERLQSLSRGEGGNEQEKR